MARPLSVVSSATLSVAAHAIALLIVSIALAHRPASISSSDGRKPYTPLVYTSAGAGRGGSQGGGNQSPAPARRIESVGRDAIAIAVPVERAPSQSQPDPRESSQRMTIPQPEVFSGLRDAIGSVAEVRTIDVDARGPGSGPGADGDKGRNIGIGARGGPGNSDGPGSGDEDGVLAGNGVSWPRLVREVKPNYTGDALRARIEGKVELEIVVLPDGTVGRIRLLRSLDSRFGLDQEAIDAVRRWRFEPGRQFGKAVSVRVGVELSFTLR
jgi:protein TonB